MTRLHAAVALIFCCVLPAYSWRDGSGWLAWTMFSKSETYRLTVHVVDRDGRRHLVNPSALSPMADAEAAVYLAGAEHFRQAPISRAFAANLPSLSRLACRTVTGAARATVLLETRHNLDSDANQTSATVSCL
ncbi:MAG TPA: hypothetical protein VGI10_21640 [Polyangiaceae bacterium]|jgi:hypothetical protein